MKVSNSELRAFKRCRRKWWVTYYRALRLQRDGVGPLSVGNMIHAPLEAYYAKPDRDPETFDWERVLDDHAQARLQDERLPDRLHGKMQDDLELARIMLRGYFQWLVDEGADSDIEVLGAEQELEAFIGYFSRVLPSGEPMPEPVWLIGKLDVPIRLRALDRLGFMDHKSVANLADLPKVGELDEQIRTYGLIQRLVAWAEGHASWPPAPGRFATGGMWNMLRKVKRGARANPPFYGRAATHHNEQVFVTFLTRVMGEVRDILAVRDALDAGGDHQSFAYPNPTRDCSWDCPLFDICARFDDGSPVEELVGELFEKHDPYERYTEVEKG